MENSFSSDHTWVSGKKESPVFVPNSFSPNGDGVNDHFYVSGDAGSMVESMQIYDRWGVRVFEIENVQTNLPDQGWDGIFASQKALPGVYVYVVRIIQTNGDRILLSGDLSLIH